MPRVRRLLVCLLLLGLALPAGAEGYSNGRLPASALSQAHTAGGFQVYLRHDAAARWNTMAHCAIRSGVDLSFNGTRSAYRPYSDQLYFWNLYRSGRGNLAAYPGTSNHGAGIAGDIGSASQRYVRARGGSLGWRKVEAFSEPWHWNYTGARGPPNPGADLQHPTLRIGSRGCLAPAVREVQRRVGFKSPSGVYGSLTAAAVRRFEDGRGWKQPDGVVTWSTWAALHSGTKARQGQAYLHLTRPHMAGADVLALQGQLNTRFREVGYRTRVELDSVFGPATHRAVVLFQRSREIRPATGVIGPATRQALRTPVARAAPTIPATSIKSSPTAPARPQLPRITINRASVHQDPRPTWGKPTDIVLHTTEGWYGSPTGGLTAASNYFAANPRKVSTHFTVDRLGQIARSVPEHRVANHAYGANATSIGIEQIGAASWTRAQWLARPQQLAAVAAIIAYEHGRYGVPLRRCVAGAKHSQRRAPYSITPVRVHGVCSHGQITVGRSDPGAGYPWDVVLRRAAALAGASG